MHKRKKPHLGSYNIALYGYLRHLVLQQMNDPHILNLKESLALQNFQLENAHSQFEGKSSIAEFPTIKFGGLVSMVRVVHNYRHLWKRTQRTLGGSGSGTTVRFSPENQHLFLITDNVLSGIEIRKNVYMSAGHVTMSDWHVRQFFHMSKKIMHRSTQNYKFRKTGTILNYFKIQQIVGRCCFM